MLFLLAGCACNPSVRPTSPNAADGARPPAAEAPSASHAPLNTQDDARLAAADELYQLGFKSLDRVIWSIIRLDNGWEVTAHNTLGQHRMSGTIPAPPRFQADSHRFIFSKQGQLIHHEEGVWEFDRPTQTIKWPDAPGAAGHGLIPALRLIPRATAN